MADGRVCPQLVWRYMREAEGVQRVTSGRFSLKDVLGGRNILLVIALALSFTSTWLINTAVYPVIDPFAAQAQYVAPLIGGFVALGFAFLCQHRPRFFTSRATMVATIAAVEALSALMLASSLWQNVPLAVGASILRWIGCILRDIVLGFALVDLSAPACVGVLACGYALRYALAFVLSAFSQTVQLVSFFICFPVGLITCGSSPARLLRGWNRATRLPTSPSPTRCRFCRLRTRCSSPSCCFMRRWAFR